MFARNNIIFIKLCKNDLLSKRIMCVSLNYILIVGVNQKPRGEGINRRGDEEDADIQMTS